MDRSRGRERPTDEPVVPAPTADEGAGDPASADEDGDAPRFSLFWGDGLNRLLGRLRLGDPAAPRTLGRIIAFWLLPGSRLRSSLRSRGCVADLPEKWKSFLNLAS